MMEHGIARAEEILHGSRRHPALCVTNRAELSRPSARHGAHGHRSRAARWSTNGAAAHDVKNLFIVDGSIWVTSGGVNPTSTIQALALYIADQMKQRLATLFD